MKLFLTFIVLSSCIVSQDRFTSKSSADSDSDSDIAPSADITLSVQGERAFAAYLAQSRQAVAAVPVYEADRTQTYAMENTASRGNQDENCEIVVHCHFNISF